MRAAAAILIAGVVLAGALPRIEGTNGDDVIDGAYSTPTTDNAERIEAKSGNDVVRAKGGDDDISGGPGNDVIYGEGGDDIIHGDGEHDQLHGGDGNDTLNAGQGNDQLYGGAGDDTLNGGAHWDYLDGQEGADTLDGGSNGDILLGRDGDDTLIGGPGDDIIVVFGNAIEEHTINGDTTTGGNTGDDLLIFSKTFNPEIVQYIELDGYGYLEVTSFSGRTDQPVNINMADLPKIDAVVTGTVNDTVVGTDRTTDWTYSERFLRSGTPLYVHELFFLGAGNDTLDTGNGDDFVDAGPGDDVLNFGAGECYVISGPGRDVMTWQGANFNNTYNKDSVVADMSTEDRIRLVGLAAAAVTLSEQASDGVTSTIISVNGNAEIQLLAIRSGTVQMRETGGAVEITLKKAGPTTKATPIRIFEGHSTKAKTPRRAR